MTTPDNSEQSLTEAGSNQAILAALRRQLDLDWDSDGGLLRHGGSIRTREYLKRLGCLSPLRIQQSLSLFAEYQQKWDDAGGTAGFIDRKFIKLLESDHAADGIQINRKGNVDRDHYSARLRISSIRLNQTSLKTLQQYDRQLQDSGVRVARYEEKLLTILEADLANDDLKASRGGKLDRQHYGKKMGLHPVYAARALSHVYSAFEKRADVTSRAEAQLPAMRSWLEDRLKTKTLTLREGKIDRLQFQRKFWLNNSFMSRYPTIRALVEEFDTRVGAEGYVCGTVEARLGRLQLALADSPALIKDLLHLDLNSLAAATNIPKYSLRRPPYGALVLAKEAEILEAARKNRIDPYFHGRVFPFSQLLDHWPRNFLERVGSRFKLTYEGLQATSAKQPYLNLVRGLTWLGASENPSCSVVRAAICDGAPVDQREWEFAVHAYRGELVSEVSQGVGKNYASAKISAFSSALKALESGGIVPPLSGNLRGIKRARRFLQPLKSVVEVVPGAKDRDDYVAFAGDQLRLAARRLNIEVADEDTNDFLSSIASELTQSEIPRNPAHAILEVINRRLEALQEHAATTFNHWKAHKDRGDELVACATIDPGVFYQNYRATRPSRRHIALLVREFFPCSGSQATPSEATLGIPNLLKLGVHHYNRLLPGDRNSRAAEEVGSFFQRRYRELGGLPILDAYLSGHKDLFGAALTLYLCESGANVSVGRTLHHDCLSETDHDGYSQVTGFKARANGKPIFSELPNSSPAVQAIRWISQSTAHLRSLASTNDAECLFVMRQGDAAQLMSSHWYTNWFKKFASKAPGLEDLRLTPNMLRPSVLLKAALENDGRVLVGQAIGQHGTQVTQGYQNKWPTRYLYDEHIRRFQSSFETLIVQSIEEVAAKLKISPKQFEERLRHLRETGLGTFCMDPRGRPGNEGRTCTTLDCWNDCPHLLVLAEIEAIATLQLWQNSLVSVQAEWERDHPERWDAVWLPWLCLTQVVEEKMKRQPLLDTWRAAEKRAAEICSSPDFAPPQPW